MKKYMQRETGVVLTGLLLFALVVGMIGCPNPAEPEIETKLLASDGAAGDCLGWSVSIDGDYAIVGAYEDDDKGSAYIFVRSGTSWTQQELDPAGQVHR
ncbi:MAG: FG-GAP repeat protein [Spirochaetes bacterium]|nr:FG-GAP repeat protein [Spirochaetota bacterium]